MLVIAPTILHATTCPGDACGRRPALWATKFRCRLAVHPTYCPRVSAFLADALIPSTELPVRSVRDAVRRARNQGDYTRQDAEHALDRLLRRSVIVVRLRGHPIF